MEGRPVFGVDGGGSSSRLRIADAANAELWAGSGEGINPNAVSLGLVAERLSTLFRRAFRESGFCAADFSAGCLAVAGVGRSGEELELESMAREAIGLSCPLSVCADCDAALVGGLRRLDGYLLISGTGSIAQARLADGRSWRAGGLGHFLGDEGSAFFVGFEAIRRSLRSCEGRDLPTSMLAPLMERFGIADPSLFIPLVYRHFDKAAIARAADLVEDFRSAGDELAVSIFEEASRELACLVSSVHERAGGLIDRPELAIWGGFISHNAWLEASVRAALAVRLPALAVRRPLETAAWGACMLALALERKGA